METINELLNFEIFRFKEHYLTIFELLSICLIIIITRLVIWFIGKVIFKKTKLDKGSSFALYQLIKYVIWITAVVFIMEAAGAEYTVILAGSAALLVGIGLGLQSTFADILSGIILLFEKSIKIDDILEIDGDIIKLQSIGLRTSKGVNPEVLEADSIDVRLIKFGASSLDFQLLFYNQNIFFIEKTKSDIRKIIVRKFHENNITIPFSQLDLNLNSKEGLIEK